MPTAIIVHGGAGGFPDYEHSEVLAACRAAVESGWQRLQQGGSALDAVESAVRYLEDHPLFNAGTGGTLNRDGAVELDAMILDGAAQRFGAVAAVRRIRNPVSLARYVLERTPHHLLAGAGAEQFAAEQGVPLIDPASLIVEKRLREAQDTVGAVALDAQGTLAVAVSTGGVRGKLPGRVGDSPIAGAGGYADNALGAACATGVGEGIMRALLTFRAVEALQGADNPQIAADQALEIFGRRFEGRGGLILIDRHGRVGLAHNTAHMPAAWIADGDKQISAQIGARR